MKKIALLSFVLFTSSFLFAQWQFGPRIGPNFSTLSGENFWDNTSNGWIAGRIVGGVAVYNLDEHLALVGEINHITSGGKFTYEVYEDGGRAISDYGYEGKWWEIYSNVQIPVMFKYTFGDKIQFYGEVGPYFTYSFCERYKDQIDDLDWEEKGKIKFVKEWPDDPEDEVWYVETKYYRRYDVGVNFGIGAQRELGNGFIALDLRFGLGLLDFNKWEENEEKPDGYKPYKKQEHCCISSLSVACW